MSILLMSKLWVRITLFSFLITSMLLQYFYFQYFGTYIQPIGFYQAFTETNEVIVSFIDEFPTMLIPTVIIFSIFAVIASMNLLKRINSYRNTVLGLLIITAVFSVNLYDTYKNLHSKSGKLWDRQAKNVLPRPYYHSSCNYMRSVNYFLVGILPKKILATSTHNFSPLPSPTLVEHNISRNVIFIVGETLRAKSIGLLGYKVNTTPQLNSLNQLHHAEVYSAGTMTKTSVSALLNRVKYPGATEQMATQTNNLFYLAKKNNFDTYFYSRQSSSDLSILQNFIAKKYINHYAPRDILKKRIPDLVPYDMALLQAVKTIDFSKYNQFVVLHQRGSHSPYHKQYPKAYKKFKKSYDNAVLYTDHVLYELITYIKSISKKPTYIIFTSDHGELLHEHGRNGHGWFFPEVYKVPFLFYTINQKEDTLKTIPLQNIQSHFDVSNLVTMLLGYDTKIKHDDTIYVNGSDIDALAGYLKIEVDENSSEINVKRY